MRFVGAAASLLVLAVAGCAGTGGPVPSGSRPGPAAAARRAPNSAPHASHVTVVIMENRDYDLIIGDSEAPYINGTLLKAGALMTDSHAIGHPSQPNYLAFFSGSTQGVTDDSCPHTFTVTNLGYEMLSANLTFDGYSESMPSDGYTGCTSGEYARKHNPWSDFSDIPASSNLIYTKFPKKPPALDFVVPNLCDDMHDCSTQTGDTWLKKNLPKIIKYDAKNNGLLILTWDEADPDANGQNQIATILVGPMIVPGAYAQDITHYSVLETIETIFAIPCTGNACKASVLTGMWQ